MNAALPPFAQPYTRTVVSLGLLACALAVASRLPVAGVVLMVQWLFSVAVRPRLSALMLSIVLAYSAVLYLSLQGLWPDPWSGAAALLLALTLAFAARLDHDRVVLALTRRNASLQQQSAVDEGTDAWSRRHILELAARELERARRNGRSFSLVLAAVDDLPLINECRGRTAGDEAVRLLVAAVKGAMRRQDAVGRLEGNRFLVLLAEADGDAAWQAALRFQLHLRDPELAQGARGAPMTISVGLASDSPDAPTLGELIDRAERALQGARAARRHHRRSPSHEMGDEAPVEGARPRAP